MCSTVGAHKLPGRRFPISPRRLGIMARLSLSGLGRLSTDSLIRPIVDVWKVIIRAIFPHASDGNLLNLVRLSNIPRVLLSSEPLKEGSVTENKA